MAISWYFTTAILFAYFLASLAEFRENGPSEDALKDNALNFSSFDITVLLKVFYYGFYTGHKVGRFSAGVSCTVGLIRTKLGYILGSILDTVIA